MRPNVRFLSFFALLLLLLSGCKPIQAPGEEPLTSAREEKTAADERGAGSDRIKVALILGVKDDPFHMAVQSGAQAKADELGIEFSADGPAHWMLEVQHAMLTDVIAQKPAAICITAIDPQQMIEPLEVAFDAGIAVFTLDTYIGSNDGDYTSGDVTFPLSYIASDNVEGGRVACQAIIRAMGDKGKIYIQKVHEGIVTLDQREQGCREAIEATNGAVELVGVDANDASDYLAIQKTMAVLKRVPDLGGLFLTDFYGIEGAGEAVHTAGLEQTSAIATFDADPTTIKALRSGRVDIVVAQHPYEMGEKCIEYAVAAASGDLADIPKRTVTGYTIITRENVDTEEGQQAIYGSR